MLTNELLLHMHSHNATALCHKTNSCAVVCSGPTLIGLDLPNMAQWNHNNNSQSHFYEQEAMKTEGNIVVAACTAVMGKRGRFIRG